jgi:hypothetical protein
MTKSLKLFALAGCAAVFATAVPAGAATPGGATVSSKKKTAAWQGADVTFSSIAFDPIGLGNDCNLLGDPFCDHFALKIDLGEGAKIQLQIKGEDPSAGGAKPYNDFDVFIYPPGPAAAPIAAGTTEFGNETVNFTHRARYRKQPYDIAVRPYLVMPGASYKGTIKVITLGKK